MNMEKLTMCRVCLAEDIRMYSIATTHLCEVYEALSLKPFKTKDIRPIRVCYICCARLQNCYQLRNSCLQSEEVFTTMLNSNEFTLPSSGKPRLTINTVVYTSVGGVLEGPMEVHKGKKECAWSEDDTAVEQGDTGLDYDTLGLSSECDPLLKIVKKEPDDLGTDDTAVEQSDTGLDCATIGLRSECDPLLKIVKKESDDLDTDDTAVEQGDTGLDYDTLGLSSECYPFLKIVKKESDDLDTDDTADMSSECDPLLKIVKKKPDDLDTGASVRKKPRLAKQKCKDMPSNNFERSDQTKDDLKTKKSVEAKSVKKKVRTPLQKYSTENLNQALLSMRNYEMSANKASKIWKVPYNILLDKCKETCPNILQIATVLTKEEEELIAKWIHHMAESGFLVTKQQILNSVGHLFDDLNKPNPFKCGMPGNNWYRAFLRRNSIVSSILRSTFTARVDATEQDIRMWFDSVHKNLEDSNCLEILLDPSRIFNCNELAFIVNPKGHAVLETRHKRSLYYRPGYDEREKLILSLGVSADGKLLPIQAILPHEQIPLNILKKYPKTWVISKSDSGLMTCQTFYKYIAYTFNGFLLKENIKKPVLLFLDGHFQHLSQQLTTFCKENGIILVPLLPSSIPAIHPLDLAVFHDLKKAWIESVYDWRMANNPRMLGKEDFGPILAECIQRTLEPEFIINGFRHAGLFPFDQNAVKYENLYKSVFTKDSRSVEQSKSVLRVVSSDFDDENIVLEPSSTGENSYIISQF